MRNLHRLTQRGDTIVEVMLVLAVLGFAIGVSYATANRSLKATRAAQESSQATELLQSQIELMRHLQPLSAAADPTTNIFQPGPYCIDPINKVIILSVSETEPAPACLQVAYGSAAEYVIFIRQTSADTFLLRAQWQNVEGQGLDSATLTYRIHPL